MEPGSPLLALRLGENTHALEPGRDYILGSADDCDLRIESAAPQHCRLLVTADGARVIDLESEAGTFVDGSRIASKLLTIGESFLCGSFPVTVLADDGTAAFVPIPHLRQAATARRIEKVRVAAAALRHDDNQSFQQLIAGELRRAPWLITSLVLHLLVILLLWVFQTSPPSGVRSIATTTFDFAAGAPVGAGKPDAPEVAIETDDDEILEDPELALPEQPAPELEGPQQQRREIPVENVTLAKRKRTNAKGGGSGRNTAAEGAEIGSGSFRETVAELQESGLEIVFVFDSTGSMTRTIQDTKSTIVEMLDVLRSLVPNARIGLVTYRDDNPEEDYLVRQVPLNLDYWRASNFVQFIVAEGGGDRPEDVRAGLRAAFAQQWRPNARRVVVLAGDAPPHPSSQRALLNDVRRFANNRRSTVHTLITSPDAAGKDTRKAFRQIAKAGNGVCAPIENRERVLQKVLTLAFGTEFAQDVGNVITNVKKERSRVDVQSLHLARVAGRPLRDALRQRPVPMALWNAIVRRPRRAVANELLTLLGDAQTASHTRHACAAALQRILDLPVPPIDAESNEPPSTRRIKRLRAVARNLPR